MSGALEIYVNRERPNALEVAESFETAADFAVEITNEGQPVHVHLNCDDELRTGLSFETGNHYVPADGVYRIPVTVDQETRPFRGKCRVSVGYGAEATYVEIRVREPDGDEAVAVDSSLGDPPLDRPRRRPLSERFLDETTAIGVLGLGLVGLLAVAYLFASITTPLAGVLLIVVVLLVSTGIYLLIG